ncbi:hypothetical protein [Vibrio caribbeanicus]|uniref:hypothetical protein n=1 Tax=Vibrio caribbeanicus TaxID=701175 RepID=UPI0030D9740C
MESKVKEIYQSVELFNLEEIDEQNTLIQTEDEMQILINWSENFHWLSCAIPDSTVEESQYPFLLQYNNLAPYMNELVLGINGENNLVIFKQVLNNIDSNEEILGFYHSVLEWKLALQKKDAHQQSITSNFIKA